MKILCLTALVFTLSIFILSAQSKDESTKPSYLEINLMPTSGLSVNGAEANFTPLFPNTPVDSIAIYNGFGGIGGELQIKYIRPLQKKRTYLSLGLFGGTHSYRPSVGVLDSVITIDDNGTRFRSDTSYDLPRKNIYYVTGSVGIRYVINSMKNDKLNLSLGGNATYYPKQKIGYNTSLSLSNRQSDLVLTSSSSLENKSKFTFDFDIDTNYQFGFKDSKFLLTLGRTWRLSFQKLSTLETELNTSTDSRTFNWDLKKNVLMGLYLGMAYQL